MRYLFGLVCACSLGMMVLIGCREVGPYLCGDVECDDENECTIDLCEPSTGLCDNTPVEDGTACSDGACMEGDCTALTSVSGTVTLSESLDSQSPAVGVTVRLHETSLSTTTGDLGEFSIDVFPGVWFFDASKEGTWGSVELYAVPTEGRTDLELVLAADAFVAQMEQALMVDIDDSKGMVTLFFEPSGGSGGESATLSEAFDFSSTFDVEGEPVLSDELLPEGESFLSFGGVDLTEELTVTPLGVDGMSSCDLEYPGAVYPVMAKFMTLVDATCAPIR